MSEVGKLDGSSAVLLAGDHSDRLVVESVAGSSQKPFLPFLIEDCEGVVLGVGGVGRPISLR